ncbi:MAG TPA: hypothetical protein VMS31_20155, partial [Pyrinomonadaceae bacterium]|nr:hypothetical protein [Pyrinomonadaceae bacterium]
VVITELGTIADGDTLKVKPEGVVLIETHTSERRIRPAVEEALGQLAELTYGKPTNRKTTIEGVEFIEWVAPDNSRQIVATILGSLVIIGNSEQSVRSCLAVATRRNASLKEDQGLVRMRAQLGADRALTFGYVPSANTARLLSVGVPLVMGRAPEDSQFQRLIASNAGKVLADLGWSSHAFKAGIEDHYMISLQPAVVARLKPDFAGSLGTQVHRRLPSEVYSVTYYRFGDPAAVWQNLKTTASSQMDVLSTVVLSSLLKSALVSYGIDEPEAFLGAVKGEILTLRLDQSGDRTMLLAGVRDEDSLRTIIKNKLGPNSRRNHLADAEVFEDSKAELGVGLTKDFIVLGTPIDVRNYVEDVNLNGHLMKDPQATRISSFVPFSSSANIVTYTDDTDRIGTFVSTLLAARGIQPLASAPIEILIAELPYSATETTLGDRGLERVTKSALGQFSTLLPLVIPEKSRPTNVNKMP